MCIEEFEMCFSMLNAGGWAEDIVNLFTKDAYIVSLVCLAIGLVLCCIECFVPGFGVLGITGIAFCAFSVVFLLVMNGTWRQFLFMLGISIIVLAVVILIAVRSARFGAISRSPLVQKDTALPTDYDKKNNEFLIGKSGTVETICKPAGKAKIDGKVYSVLTDGEYVEKGANIVVQSVDGPSILVKQIDSSVQDGVEKADAVSNAQIANDVSSKS